MRNWGGDFLGAKLMLFAGPRLIALRRDHAPGLVWPGCLDFPGGGREGHETPAACARRETREEVGLDIPESAMRLVHLRDTGNAVSWFFAAHEPPAALDRVRFGGEGAGWLAMDPWDFVADQSAIPHFRDILRAYLEWQAGKEKGRSG